MVKWEVFPGVCQWNSKTETKGKAVANYDSAGMTYDSGIFYDAPLPQPYKRMAKMKVKLNLDLKPDNDLSPFAAQHITAMTGNLNFTTPLPSAATVASTKSAFDTALANSNTAQAAAKLATSIKDTARAALENVLTQRASYVELTAASAADPTSVIESAAFSVRATPTPAGMPEMVPNLSITSGDNAGELDLQWDTVAGARTYEIQTSPDPMTPTSFTSQPSVTKSKAIIMGMTSGVRMWTRVRAVNPAGQGAWSDVATKIVP